MKGRFIIDAVGIFGMLLLIVLICMFLPGCATKAPDFPICVEMSLTRGECIKVISGEKIRVDEDHKMNGKTWWEARPTNMVMPMESWMELKKYIIKMCKVNKDACDQEVSSWQRSIEKIDDTLSDKGIDVPALPPDEPAPATPTPEPLPSPTKPAKPGDTYFG